MSEGLELFPVAIGIYGDVRFKALEVDAEVAEIVSALAVFDIQCVEWGAPVGQRTFDVVNARLNQWSKSTVPQTILYWVGHGWSDGRNAALAHADSPAAVRTQGVSAQRIADAIATRDVHLAARDPTGGSSWMIVVVDACQSAAFVRELKAEIMRRAPDTRTGYLLIGGLAGAGATNLGRFSRELRFFLDTVCATDFTIPLRRMATHFESQDAEVEQKRLLDEVVLRRRHSMLVNLDLDTRNQLLAALDALDSDELRHFLPKAYGGEMPFTETMLGEQSWYFQGRHDETRQIADWLKCADTGMLVVTGPAGSGKSALLGHLVVHTNPTLRTALRRANLVQSLPPDEQPPDNIFDAVLHLTGATTEEVVDRLAALTEHRTRNGFVQAVGGLNEAVNHLINEITSSHRRVTILVDALDEAVEPLLVADRILAILARTLRVRVVVGTRASTHESPDRPSPDTDLLDALCVTRATTVPITADATAVAGYVRQRLQTSRTALLDPSGAAMDVESLIAAVYRRAPQFLFARLLVHELLADPHQRTPSAWTRLLAGEHRSLFATAVTRLTIDQPALLSLLTALAYARGRGLPAADNLWTTAARAITTEPTTTISNTDVERLTEAAAAYVLADREHGQTVYRLAHRTFTEYFTNDTEPTRTDRDRHLAITDALIATTTEYIERVLTGTHPLNPYIVHYLAAHAAIAGRPGWDHLDPHTALLLALDQAAVASNAWRSSSGRYPLPETVAAITTLNTHLQLLQPRDRYLPIRVHNRHTNPQDTVDHLPPWAPPITVESTTHSPSSPHRILTGHTGSVRALVSVVMPDGCPLLAVAAGDDGVVWLWDPVTGREHGQLLTGHTGGVRALVSVVMPDGRILLASAGGDGTVRLWDPVTGREHGQLLTGHTGGVEALASVVMPDGRILLASAGGDGTVRLWDPATGREHGLPFTGHTGSVKALASVVMPDGHTLLASGGEDRTVQLWDPVTGRRYGWPITGRFPSVVEALVSVVMPDGRTLLASGGDDGAVWLRNPVTGREHGLPFIGHTGPVKALVSVVMPDGRVLLASASSGGEVWLWDPVTDREHGQLLTGHTDGVRALVSVVMPDGRTVLASGGEDRTVRLWDLTTNEPATSVARTKTSTNRIGSSRFAARIRVRALSSVVMPDGRSLLASGGGDGAVRLWDPATGREQGWPIDSRTGGVRALVSVVMPDGRSLLASAGGVRKVGLWDPVTGREHRGFLTGNIGLGASLVSVVMPDGRTLLASASGDGAVWVWDSVTDREHRTFSNTSRQHSKRSKRRWWHRHRRLHTGHTGSVRALVSVVMPDGCPLLAVAVAVAAAGDDGVVWLWDPVTGREHGQLLTGHTGGVRALASVAMPDGRILLASAGGDGTVRLWDPVTGRGYGQPVTGHLGSVEALASVVMPEGHTLLASGGEDRTVRLWDLTTSEAVLWHTLSLVPVPIVALHAIGDRLAVATQNSIIVLRLHHPNTRSLSETPNHQIGTPGPKSPLPQTNQET